MCSSDLSMSQLRELYLEGTQIGSQGARIIASGMPDLIRLNLAQNDIDDEGAEAIASMGELQILTLFTNRIEDAGVRAILGGLPNLKKLDLRCISIGPEGNAMLAQKENQGAKVLYYKERL